MNRAMIYKDSDFNQWRLIINSKEQNLECINLSKNIDNLAEAIAEANKYVPIIAWQRKEMTRHKLMWEGYYG